MTKQEIRKTYKANRNALTPAERSKLDDLLLIQLQLSPLPFIESLFSYWPIEEQSEPNTHLFTDYIEFKNPGLLVGYPRTGSFMNEMLAIETSEETSFVMNEFNIYEPEQGVVMDPSSIDMVLVPLIAFDKNGFRVGFGKGMYDKFLTQVRKDCLKVGFSYFEPVDLISDKNEFDVPLNLCITPQQFYVF